MLKKIKEGDRFGSLVVERFLEDPHVEPSGKKRKKAIIRCDCGDRFEMIAMQV
jgi:hypothetical protein